MDYFSVTISLICIVDDGKRPEDGYLHDIQVHIVEANDFEEAKIKALAIGRSEELIYKSDGYDAFWKFKEIEYIRRLGKEVVGVEIATRFERSIEEKIYSGATSFGPQNSDPIVDDESST